MLPIEKILWPTDFSEASYEALPIVKEFASRFSAEIVVAHVVTPVPALGTFAMANLPRIEEEVAMEAKRSLDDVVRSKIGEGFQVCPRIQKGDAAQEIVHLAEDEKANIIIIATHGTSGFKHMLFGSVTEKVIRLTQCPVLVIRTPADEE
jgi:nucleotide-binding universal stress UspA family protein